MNNPLISVIIPVYNPGKNLFRCLDSVMQQTYCNLQIILIDDGSTDGSAAVCDEYAARDERIICVHQANGGVSKARNAGLALVTGDYVSFPDSDDYLETDTYEYLLKLIQEKGVDSVCFEYYVTYPGKENTHHLASGKYGRYDTKGAHHVIQEGCPFLCTKFFPAKAVKEVRFREDIHRGEDSLFAHSALENVESMWFDPRPLYHYVQSEDSACRGSFRPSQLSMLKLHDAYKPLYKEKYPELWHELLEDLQELYISIYYDMWADSANYTKEQKNLFSEFRKLNREIGSKPKSAKKFVKISLFSCSPQVFCIVHKLIHRL